MLNMDGISKSKDRISADYNDELLYTMKLPCNIIDIMIKCSEKRVKLNINFELQDINIM